MDDFSYQNIVIMEEFQYLINVEYIMPSKIHEDSFKIKNGDLRRYFAWKFINHAIHYSNISNFTISSIKKMGAKMQEVWTCIGWSTLCGLI